MFAASSDFDVHLILFLHELKLLQFKREKSILVLHNICILMARIRWHLFLLFESSSLEKDIIKR